MRITFWSKTFNICLILKKYYGQNNLFIVKSTLKNIIYILKLLQKNFECFTSKPNSHGILSNLYIKINLKINISETHLISLSKFNLPLIGTFMWPTLPGPYRATTCRGRELNYGSYTYFFDHTSTWRASPNEWSAQFRGHLRDNTNVKDDSHHSRTQ